MTTIRKGKHTGIADGMINRGSRFPVVGRLGQYSYDMLAALSSVTVKQNVQPFRWIEPEDRSKVMVVSFYITDLRGLGPDPLVHVVGANVRMSQSYTFGFSLMDYYR